MVVRVGPVSSASVHTWVTYARRVLLGHVPGADQLPDLEADVLAELRALLDEWDALAAEGGDVVWIADIAPERVEHLVHTFHRVAEALAGVAARRGQSEAPPEAGAFYQALVAGILDALAGEDPSTTELGEALRSTWPGVDPT